MCDAMNITEAINLVGRRKNYRLRNKNLFSLYIIPNSGYF